jgi:hypothetical protein
MLLLLRFTRTRPLVTIIHLLPMEVLQKEAAVILIDNSSLFDRWLI